MLLSISKPVTIKFSAIFQNGKIFTVYNMGNLI